MIIYKFKSEVFGIAAVAEWEFDERMISFAANTSGIGKNIRMRVTGPEKIIKHC